jgi:hypothetical protein
MKVFLIAFIAAVSLTAVLATSAVGDTNGHFPEGVSPQGCGVVIGTPAAVTGSDTGFANKVSLFMDACPPPD